MQVHDACLWRALPGWPFPAITCTISVACLSIACTALPSLLQGIAMLNLGSTKTGLLLLWGLFVYDIFWVFCTPVMVRLADDHAQACVTSACVTALHVHNVYVPDAGRMQHDCAPILPPPKPQQTWRHLHDRTLNCFASSSMP